MIVAEWGLPDALTRQAAELTMVWKVFVVVGLAVSVVVYGLLAFAIVRYRRSDDLLPRQVHYRIKTEIAYTVLPLILIAGLLVVTLRGIAETEARADEPDIVVDVVGSQWRWDFSYRGGALVGQGAIDDVPELVLPVGASVRFTVASDDVIHSFWIPGFLYKRDLIPGEVQSFDVDMGDQTGTWVGRCAEFCGLEHYSMQFELRIVDAAAFVRWVRDRQGSS